MQLTHHNINQQLKILTQILLLTFKSVPTPLDVLCSSGASLKTYLGLVYIFSRTLHWCQKLLDVTLQKPIETQRITEGVTTTPLPPSNKIQDAASVWLLDLFTLSTFHLDLTKMHFSNVQPGYGLTWDSQRSCYLGQKRLLQEEEGAFETLPHCQGSQGSLCGPVNTYWQLTLSAALCKCQYHILPQLWHIWESPHATLALVWKYKTRKVHLTVEPLEGFELFWFWPVRKVLGHGGCQELFCFRKTELFVL